MTRKLTPKTLLVRDEDHGAALGRSTLRTLSLRTHAGRMISIRDQARIFLDAWRALDDAARRGLL